MVKLTNKDKIEVIKFYLKKQGSKIIPLSKLKKAELDDIITKNNIDCDAIIKEIDNNAQDEKIQNKQKPLLKDEIIDCIKYYFNKQGKQLTNLSKTTKNKLDDIITKYNIDCYAIKNEMDENKRIVEIKKKERQIKLDEEENDWKDRFENLGEAFKIECNAYEEEENEKRRIKMEKEFENFKNRLITDANIDKGQVIVENTTSEFEFKLNGVNIIYDKISDFDRHLPLYMKKHIQLKIIKQEEREAENTYLLK